VVGIVGVVVERPDRVRRDPLFELFDFQIVEIHGSSPFLFGGRSSDSRTGRNSTSGALVSRVVRVVEGRVVVARIADSARRYPLLEDLDLQFDLSHPSHLLSPSRSLDAV